MGNPTRELTLRVPDWLGKLVRECAAHCGLEVSDVIRRTARWYARNPSMYGLTCDPEIRKMLHKSREAKCVSCDVIRARDVELPDGVTPDDFREALAFRCRDAMTRPSCKEVSINFLCMNGDGLTPQAIDKEA